MMNHKELLEKVFEFDKQGLQRKAIQVLLNVVDDWMYAGDFDECKNLLDNADPTKLSVVVSLGVLASVHPIKKQISDSRTKFVSLFRSHLEKTRPDEVEILMNGVE